jgi:DNA-binding transcriptional LysR family regulator
MLLALFRSQHDDGCEIKLRSRAQQASVTVCGRVRVNAAEGLRAAVLADMGLTIESDWMFGPELASGQVRRVLADWSLPPIDLWAVFPAGRMASAKARAFASFVEAAMESIYSQAA